MRNARTFKLERIKKGKPVFFTVCTQCASKAIIELLDDTNGKSIKKIETKGGCRVDCPAAVTIECCPCNAPSVRISIDNDAVMKVQRNPQIIIGHNGEEKGVNYTFHIEDNDRIDADYNDYYINIVSWDYAG